VDEQKEMPRDYSEKREPRDRENSGNREVWEKQESLLKVEQREWRENKNTKSIQIQAKNNR